MRFFTVLGRGLLGASTLAALVAAGPVQAQYSPYPQTAASYPQATAQTYAQPAQQAQGGYAQAAQQPYVQAARPVAHPAVAQQAMAPYAQAPQQAAQQYAAPATVYSQYAPAQGYNPARPAAQPTYMAANPNPNAAAAGTFAAQGYPQVGQVQQPSQQSMPQYAASPNPPRMAMAQQGPTTGLGDLSLTPPAESVPPGAVQNGNGAYVPQPVPTTEYAPAQGYPAQGYPAQTGVAAGADCNCQSNGYESYPAAGGGNGAAYGSCAPYSTHGCEEPGMMARVLGKHGGGYWFGGVYGLVMDRDSSNKYPLTFAGAGYAPGDYPTPDTVVLNSRDVDGDFQGGVEFRLGRTFGGGGFDPCGGCACGPSWGLETVYWTLFENNEYAQYIDSGSVRTYSMMPMRGLVYDPGSGSLPVHDFWDYAPPVPATSQFIVTMTKARSSFEVQNFELNLLRLSLCGNACGGPAMCNVGCDGGSCDTCATGDCAGGGCATGQCGTGGYACRRPSRFSCTGVCGVRYLEFDESFMYGVNYYNTTTTTDGFLDYWAETENKLIGAQLGCNGMYRIGCKWGVHMNTLVGLYGNDIDVRQYFNNPTGGQVYYTTGEVFDVNASKTDVAMLGEVRLGVSYQATCRCRVYGGWRAIGVSGLALAGDQTPNAFLNAAQLSNYVNSNGSMILHGLQTGVEWNY